MKRGVSLTHHSLPPALPHHSLPPALPIHPPLPSSLSLCFSLPVLPCLSQPPVSLSLPPVSLLSHLSGRSTPGAGAKAAMAPVRKDACARA